MKSKLEKGTHFLDREKGEFSGHGKKGVTRGTYWLERSEVVGGQDMKRKQAREGNSHAGGGRGYNWSGHGKKASQEEALTFWRGQSSELVRTQKKCKLVGDTHFLERAKVRAGQDI